MKTAEERRAAKAEYARAWRKKQRETNPDWWKNKLQEGREWREKNPELVRKYAREGYVRRKEKYGALLAAQKKEFDRRKQLRKYGISPEQYDSMMAAQGGKCAICGDAYEKLHVDHDHKTGATRKLLCTRCNPGLGYFRDSVELLRIAIAYIESHSTGGPGQ